MFLRCTQRRKDGKEHRYWSIVENRRGANRRVIQRQILYLGEINDSQRAVWCHSIEVFEPGNGERRQVALFPADREAPELAHEVVHLRLDQLQVKRLHLVLPDQPPPRISLQGQILPAAGSAV